MKGVRFIIIRASQVGVRRMHGYVVGVGVVTFMHYIFNTIQRKTESICSIQLTYQADTYPALNLIPTLNHPSAPQQHVLNQARSASGGNSMPWNIGVASGYGLLLDLGNKSGRWAWSAVRIVVGLPEC